jgi:GH43 family beta-xylosidase
MPATLRGCTATAAFAMRFPFAGRSSAQATTADDDLLVIAEPEALARAFEPAPASFCNPIVAAVHPAGSADPSVVFHDGHYHYCRSLADGALGIARARRLQDIGRAEMVVVWRPEPGTMWSREIWAPELQRVQGRWVIYFAASDGHNRNHRMYALEAEGDDLQGRWHFKGRIAAPTDTWAIDGIAVEHAGGLYFVWSGWRRNDDGFPQVLYIAPMSDPFTISGERVEIAAPALAWEQRGASLLEGPAVLYRDGRVFIAYSASASWTDDYALGLLVFEGGDILSPAAWRRIESPVFAQCRDAGVYGPGHNSFVTSPDGREDWMVYHAIGRSGGGWAARSVRAQRITWRADGLPDFGRPVGAGVPVIEPSGTPCLRPKEEAELALADARRARPAAAAKRAPRRQAAKAAAR